MENLDFFNKVKGFLISPVHTFQEVKDEAMKGALRYFIAWIIIFSIMFAIAVTFILPIENLGPIQPLIDITQGIYSGIAFFFMALIAGIFSIFIGAGILHIGAILVGGKNGYRQTFKASVYSLTPSFILGWFPLLLIPISIWSFILVILGLRELHDISTGKAFLAAILPTIIILGVTIAFTMIIGYPF